MESRRCQLSSRHDDDDHIRTIAVSCDGTACTVVRYTTVTMQAVRNVYARESWHGPVSGPDYSCDPLTGGILEMPPSNARLRLQACMSEAITSYGAE